LLLLVPSDPVLALVNLGQEVLVVPPKDLQVAALVVQALLALLARDKDLAQPRKSLRRPVTQAPTTVFLITML
jgi:hypothetical protein